MDVEKVDNVPFYYGEHKASSHSGYKYPPISSIFKKLRSVNGAKYQLLISIKLDLLI